MSTPRTLERYLAHLRNERRLSPHTLSAYRRDADLLVALCGDRTLERLAGADIRRFVSTLHGRGLSPRSLARVLSSWRGLYDWLARARAVTSNPCLGVRAPRAAKRLPQTLSPDEAAEKFGPRAEGLGAHQKIANAHARAALGWQPRHASLVSQADLYYAAYRAHQG